MRVCLDTYALIEIHDRNPAFKHLMYTEWLTTDLTLSEFYGILYKRHNEKTATHWCDRFSVNSVKPNLGVLLRATKFRIENRKRNLSFFDCVGYIYSLENGLQFVTGDKEFRDIPNVLFIA